MRDALRAQDYLYTLHELVSGAEGRIQVVGAIGDFLLAEEGAEALIERLADPVTRIVSLTITEGGYCTDDSTGEFLADLPEIQQDLAHPQQPVSVFGFLTEALARRRERGIPPFTLMSCDNLPHNGDVARMRCSPLLPSVIRNCATGSPSGSAFPTPWWTGSPP